MVYVFLGKGGVGKTTCSAATALVLAQAGEATLVISTDPTPSLSHIFEIEGAHREREVLPGLFVTELGLQDLRGMWNDRFGREMYAVFSSFVDIEYDTFVEFVTSILPGLNEEFMVDYIRRLASEGRYRHIVWDTAPLGQTLALLAMPSLLVEHLRIAPRIYSHLKASSEQRRSVMEIIRNWSELAALCLEFLRHDVHFSMVTIAEGLAVRQLYDVMGELHRYGLQPRRLIINNVVEGADSPFRASWAQEQRSHLEWLSKHYANLPTVRVPRFPQEIRGADRLRPLGRLLCAATPGSPA